ncbi:PREDICTED: tubulin polyglutamylase complex subunit 2 [Dufourea novaeangliae]|uniref:Tubulin polyglutamylase complex subunit 2 n=1 Tax=Dufourea novaeangliae TaxID=178035 RepID=A0A154PJ67_DUFNO|nr:PREDICTED: tubulin polyglutamylase complex subunit 2 [Dufourea novaeangliae]KZC11899.1 Tubulin polyglutamylase complex subunit 2 [Dufourea novaeangliae]
MSFFVDVVTEDSFYENLTVGVVKILEGLPYVKNVRVERRNGCEDTVISNWEQRHCCLLPEDLRNFYLSIDGFQLLWNLEIAGEEFSVGRMEIGSFSTLKRCSTTRDHQLDCPRQESTDPGSEIEPRSSAVDLENACSLQAGSSQSCKMFEIARCYPEIGMTKVYLVYCTKPEAEAAPSIWLHREELDRWYHLADSFTVYFRMMLVHLGLPLWQCCVAGVTLPTWVEQVYFLVGPHLLPATVEATETISATLWSNGPTNVIDPGIFKGKDGKQKIPRRK